MRVPKKSGAAERRRAKRRAETRGHVLRLAAVVAVVLVSAIFTDTKARAQSREDYAADRENARWAALSWFSWRDWKFYMTHSRSSHAVIRGYQNAVDEKVYQANVVVDNRVVPLMKDMVGQNGRVAQAKGIVVGGGTMVGMVVAPEFTLPAIGGYNVAMAPINNLQSQANDAERILRRPGFNAPDPAEIARMNRDRNILFNFDMGVGTTALAISPMGQAAMAPPVNWYLRTALSASGRSAMASGGVFNVVSQMLNAKGSFGTRWSKVNWSAVTQDVLMSPVFNKFTAGIGKKFKAFHPKGYVAANGLKPPMWGLQAGNLAKSTAIIYTVNAAYASIVKSTLTGTDPMANLMNTTFKTPLGTAKYVGGELALRQFPKFFPPDPELGARGNPKFVWANKIIGLGLDLLINKFFDPNKPATK